MTKIAEPNNKEVKEHEMDVENKAVIDIAKPCKVHGVVENKHAYGGEYMIFMVETEDNQIDFTRLYIRNKEKLSEGGYFN